MSERTWSLVVPLAAWPVMRAALGEINWVAYHHPTHTIIVFARRADERVARRALRAWEKEHGDDAGG